MLTQQTSRIKRPDEIVSLKVPGKKNSIAVAGAAGIYLPSGDEKPLSEFAFS